MDCKWNGWTLGQYSVTCGGGERIDNRTLAVQEEHGGLCNISDSQRVVPCNTIECEGKNQSGHFGRIFPVFLSPYETFIILLNKINSGWRMGEMA